MAIVSITDKITALYVGYFNRAPDPAGLSYWIGRANAGMSINDIANSFAAQPEATSTYSYLAAPNFGDPTAFVQSIYQNLFNRAADQAGLTYWVNQLTTGKVSAGLMINAIIGGAQGSDSVIMSNKVAVGEVYAQAFIAQNDTWTNTDNLASAQKALAGGSVFGATFVQVTADPATVTANSTQAQALALALHNNPLQITITPTLSAIQSGGGVDFIIQEAPSQANKVVGYTLNGLNLPGEVAQTSGTVLLDSTGRGTIHVNTLVTVGSLNTNPENFTATVGGVSSSAVTLTHGSQAVVVPGSVNEGNTFTFTVQTTNIASGGAAGLTESFTIGGAGINQIAAGDRSGQVTIAADGTAVVTIHTLANQFNSNTNPSITITVGNDAPVSVQINNVATQAVTPSAASIVEGGTVTFSVSTGGGVNLAAVAGTVETWTLTGSGINQVAGGVLSGQVVLDSNGLAAITVPTLFNIINGPATQSLTLTLFNGGVPVTTSTITINEATMTVVAPANPISEGNSVTFTINATNVPNGTTEAWTLSGAALGNVFGATKGLVTFNNGVGTVFVQTISNDISGLTKGLTLTLDNVPGAGATATAQIKEDQAPSFILTTATDSFTGSTLGNNKFFSVVNSDNIALSTIGQNDQLNGNSSVVGSPNTLFIAAAGGAPLLVTNFTTSQIQTFDVNVNNTNNANGGTRIDMSSTGTGANAPTLVIDDNSSSNLQLLNIQAPLALEIRNPSDFGNTVSVGMQYVAGQLAAVNAAGQQITLDPTVSPLTGLPNSAINAPGVTNFIISSNPGGAGSNSSNANGLISLNQAVAGMGAPFNAASNLTSVTMNGSLQFVLGAPGSGVPGMAFTGANNTLNLAAFTANFYNIGDAGNKQAITAAGNLTITGGSGNVVDRFVPVGLGATQIGGAGAGLGRATILETAGNMTVNLGTGSFVGQQLVNSGGGSISISGGAGSGGFLSDNLGNAATIVTAPGLGAVSVTGIQGGLGNVNGAGTSYIVTNTTTGNGGSLVISGVGGGINEQISTGTGGATINQTGQAGNVTLDFSQVFAGGNAIAQRGFHAAGVGVGLSSFTGSTVAGVVNTLLFDPSINNNTNAFGEGVASNVTNLILQSPAGTVWAGNAAPNGGGVVPVGSVGLAQLGNPTNVFIGGLGNTSGAANVGLAGLVLDGTSNPTFTGVASGENFFVDTKSTNALAGQIFGFDFGNSANGSNTLNFTVQGPNAAQTFTVRDFGTNGVNNNPVGTFNLTMNAGGNGQVATVTLDTLGAIKTLNLQGSNAMTLLGGATGNGTLTTITGGDSNINLNGLVNGAANGYLSGGNATAANSQNLFNNWAAALIPTTFAVLPTNTITLGNGADQVTVNGGSWTIFLGNGGNVVTLNPGFGNSDFVSSGTGNDTFNVGNGGGIVHLAGGAGNDTFNFNMGGPNPGLNSSQFIDGGTGFDTIVLNNGPVNENDSLFAHIINVEGFTVAGGVNNSLLLNFLANASGITTINTSGGGSSNVFREGTGFLNSLTYNIANNDTGADAIIVSPVSGPITVNASVAGFNAAFEGLTFTNAVDPGTLTFARSGIFATGVGNVLNLTADGGIANILGTATNGVQNVQTINGVNGGGASETIFLATNPNLFSKVSTIDLHNVIGQTTVWAMTATNQLTITGGAGGTSTLIGGVNGDTIKAVSTGPNFIWGNGSGLPSTGGDILTGAQGSGGVPGGGSTTFIFNTLADLLSNGSITNFHPASDSFFINPLSVQAANLALAPNSNATSGAIIYMGHASGLANLNLLLTGGGNLGGAVQEAYDDATGLMWIDIDNNGIFNASDIHYSVTFGSPAPDGVDSINNFDVNGKNSTTADVINAFNTYANNQGAGIGFANGNVVVTAQQNQVVADGTTLQPGQPLFGGPGLNDTLTLGNNTNIENGNIGITAPFLAFAFENLVFNPGTAEVSVAQWNWFDANLHAGHSLFGIGTNTVVFSDGTVDPVQTSMTTNVSVENYDFHLLTNAINMTTPAFNGGGAMGAGTVLGTNKNDTFNVSQVDLKAGFTIDGNGGTGDVLNVGGNLVFGTVFGGSGVAGTTNAQVTNVEIMNLVGAGANTIGFNAGTAFNVVNGDAGPDTIIDPENLAGNWTLNLDGGANNVTIKANNANLTPGTITGATSLTINASGASNTTMKFGMYTLFNANGIGTAGGSNFGNTTITFFDQVTGGAVLAAAVGNWVFSNANDTFTLGALAQNIDISSGGADTAIYNIAGAYTGNIVGASSNDTIKFTANANIAGVNGGAATGAGNVDFSSSNLSVTMTNNQHNGFTKPFGNTGGTQTITITDLANMQGDVGIENYVLQSSGNDQFRVTADNGQLVGGHQNVTFNNGGSDTVFFGTGTFTGNVNGLSHFGGTDTVLLDGNADISGVNSGGAFNADALDFANTSSSVKMTAAQHNDFNQPFLRTGGTQTITLTTSSLAIVGDAGIENYVLASGNDIFTVGAAGQNVDISSGGADVIQYGTNTFTGNLVGASSNDTVRFTGNANISGVNGGAATGAGSADFTNNNRNVTMTLAQHNGFNQPFLGTGGTQTITLTTSGTATGDGGIESYVLASGNDVFTVAANSGGFNQDVNISSGGADVIVFGAGSFSGNLVGAGADDTVRFTGNANISGLNSGGATGAKSVDFNNAGVSVTMTLAQHNGFNQPFGNTTGTQTITLTTSGTLTGDVGIENYILANGNDVFTVGAAGQNVDISSGGSDTVVYGLGVWTGNLVGAANNDTVKFNGNANISSVNGGATTGAGTFDFNNAANTVTMTLVQHNGPTSFTNTGGPQTIILTTSGTATGNAGIENYTLASGNDIFTVGANGQNVNISSGGADIIVYGTGVFTGNLVGAAADDTVRLTGNTSDISGVNGGAATGAGSLDFNNGTVVAKMTVAQHNGFAQPFLQTGGNQTITLTTDGTVTGDAGIETYNLAADGTHSNVFTVGAPGQNVNGGGDDDIVINNFGGNTGVLTGGSNTPAGDTLILGAANTILAIGSGGFENLTLTTPGANVTMSVAAHNGFTGVISAPGSNLITLSTNGTVTGLAQIESYTLANGGANTFTFTNAQTGTITGGNGNDIFNATAAQVGGVVKIIGGGGSDTLNISTDANGLNLNTKTSGLTTFNLNAGSTGMVFGANGAGIVVNATGAAKFTMGTGQQTYNGGAIGNDVTFGVGNDTINMGVGDDIVRSTVGGSLAGANLDGGAGFNTLMLVTGDDISGATVKNFQQLVVADNATVSMTNAEHNAFAAGQILGAGNETIKITDAFTGTTQVQIENYTLATGTVDHAFTIAGNGQTITDLDANGNNTATVKAGLDAVTLIANSGANWTVNLNADTNLNVTLGSGIDTVNVTGAISGSVNAGGGTDLLSLANGADIHSATILGFENLTVATNGSVTMTAGQWFALQGGTIIGAGTETVTFTDSIGSQLNSASAIENYILNGVGNDTFNYTLTGGFGSVNISAGGNDHITLTNAVLGTSQDDHITITGFSTGAGADTLTTTIGATNMINNGFQLVTANNTNLTNNSDSTIVVNTGAQMLTNPGDLTLVTGQVVTAIGAALGTTANNNGQSFNYTIAFYDNAGNADVYEFHTTIGKGNDITAASIDKIEFIGVLTGVGANTLNGSHFV